MFDSINVQAIRADFPILSQTIGQHPLAYLDNAATTQKPNAVINAVAHYYQQDNANVHRGVHTLSERATALFESARQTVAQFINAPKSQACIFVRGTTEAINLVANSYLLPRLKAGDEVLVTHLEHHSNIVPWQLICEQVGAKVIASPINDKGEVDLEQFKARLTDKTAFVAINHVSNALGSINPIKAMIDAAHKKNIKVLVDGAQAVPHMRVDVQALGCDFYAFSGHKMYGPTGIGCLWGRESLLDEMRPYQGGGDMIRQVSFAGSEFAPLPNKFEAGTPNIAGAIGLAAAIEYIENIGLEAIALYEQQLLDYATEALSAIDGIRLIGQAEHKAAVLSFVHDTVHAHDIGTILNTQGVAIRSGHHCAMPVMDFYGVAATTRASFSFYNTREEIDQFIDGMQHVHKLFA